MTEPRSKGHDRYYFYASCYLYYFDEYRNVYSENGTLICDGSLNQLDDLLSPNFYIDGVPYWFELGGLLRQDADGTVNRVYIWQSDAEPFNLGLGFDPTAFLTDVTTLVHRPAGSPCDRSQAPSPEYIFDTLWSPSSSLVAAPASEASEEPRLFPGSQAQASYFSGAQTISTSRQDVTQVQKDAETARPMKKPSKDERRRCPICSKMFRRPSSLEDHLNLHYGRKPYICPYEGCTIGFVTKSNMKRHFLTHRVGPLEQYQPTTTLSETYRLDGGNTISQTEVSVEATTPVLDSHFVKGIDDEEEQESEPADDPTSVIEREAMDNAATKLGINTITKYHFYASSHFYYLDEYRRVYSEDGTLIHDGSVDFHWPTDKYSSPAFHIDGEPYWFDRDHLMTRDINGVHNRVHTWQSGSEIIGRHMSMHEMFHHLLHHGCLDLSSQMDTQQDTATRLGGGGFGDIWSGKLSGGTQVAIKTWRECDIEQCDYKLLKRATREIYLWSKLKHENVQPLMGIMIFKGHYLGMVSQWMENGNLHGYMRKNPDFDRYRMSVQVASGLAYMHEHDAVHGDLKALNVLVSLDGVARLTDFGLSTMSEAGLAFSETTTTQARTARWASPEQLLEESPSNKQSDVYALGMTILEIFTGNVPYPECPREIQVLIRVQKGILPTRPTDQFWDNQHGHQMWGLLTSCWSRDPDVRPTAKGVVESLNAISSAYNNRKPAS